ncbi:MAG: hypothetical protein COU11_03085 [Candidatus Harrisonbacteria bacterium CG10_big_fil_rev_8_21_14_0_10_49_15]|uniref:ATP synthase subunit a n=1 Tax=Candidatus Harrisonbacteria bacterium CG10_big_fil_rev_8_21_14_0_10_49_15 TaxID=1974587 RepID=A0A2H0UKN8_9BACT|nr:MAG: hypothetical protein COU11_03085 [Candidatus Harrisonbacteria bacterium CG10_big_fil_rev_8_21_14_0_10_49_15]
MEGNFFQIKGDIPDIAPDVVFSIGSWPISNTALQIVLLLVLSISFCALVIRRFSVEKPGKFQIAIEGLYESMVTFTEQLSGSRQKANEILPIILSLFVFVGVANLINIIPGLTSITWDGIAIFRTPTSDFNTTLGMALAMIIFIQATALTRLGVWRYLGQFIKIKPLIDGFHQGFSQGMTALIEFGIGFLDIVSELAKILSLSLRLFGNIYAGEVLLVMIFGALAFVLPSLWMTLSLFFGIIQAIVFGALCAAYYASSVPDAKVIPK